MSDWDPCRLVGGNAILNLPNVNGLELVAMHREGQQTTQAAILEPQKIQDLANGQALYTISFTGTSSGNAPLGGNVVTINDVNSLALWNNSGENVGFITDNNVALNAVLSQ